MVLLPNISGSGDAAIVARRLIEALEELFFVKSDQLQLGSSVGIALAQRLDIQTIAEGVETEQQLDILHSEGCHNAVQ